MYGELEVRINVHPASTRNRFIEKAERELAVKIKAAARKLDWADTIDIDYFDSEAGAFAPLIVELFAEGRHYDDVLAPSVYPVTTDVRGRVPRGEAEEAADSIRDEIPTIVEKVERSIQKYDGSVRRE